jgi:hypothetical protein
VSLNIHHEVDPRFARIERVLQRIGWALIVVLIGLAAAGLFGGGVLSNRTVRSASGGNEIELTYPRFGRQESNLQMTLEVAAPQAQGQELRVRLSGDVREKVTIMGITPEPDTTAFDGDVIVFTWTVESWARPPLIVFDYEAHDWRSIGGEIEVMAGQDSVGGLSFEQFLFP